MTESRMAWGMLTRRQGVALTGRGWLALGLLGLILLVTAVKGVHPFLALNDSRPGGILVVEGWASDRALEEVVREFGRHHYDAVFVTGGPIEKGAHFERFKTYAEIGAATLVRTGLPTNILFTVPAPLVHQDRTYASAQALKQWLREHNVKVTRLNVMSVGVHSRRTRMLFATLFRNDAQVGIIAIDEQRYDPQRWWTGSMGVRVVVDEVVAYVYAKLFFWPAKQ